MSDWGNILPGNPYPLLQYTDLPDPDNIMDDYLTAVPSATQNDSLVSSNRALDRFQPVGEAQVEATGLHSVTGRSATGSGSQSAAREFYADHAEETKAEFRNELSVFAAALKDIHGGEWDLGGVFRSLDAHSQKYHTAYHRRQTESRPHWRIRKAKKLEHWKKTFRLSTLPMEDEEDVMNEWTSNRRYIEKYKGVYVDKPTYRILTDQLATELSTTPSSFRRKRPKENQYACSTRLYNRLQKYKDRLVTLKDDRYVNQTRQEMKSELVRWRYDLQSQGLWVDDDTAANIASQLEAEIDEIPGEFKMRPLETRDEFQSRMKFTIDLNKGRLQKSGSAFAFSLQ